MAGPAPFKKTTSRQVFLSPELWEKLKMDARFHSRVFKLLGSKYGVSRNDMVESFLEWAHRSYWDDKGGEPDSDVDFERKAKKHAEQVKKLDKE